MDAVCFDMDGVLVDSEDYWVDLEREELLPEVVPDDDVAVAEITGMNYQEIYDYLEERYGTAVSREAFVDRFDEVARELYTERVALLEGFRELRAELSAREVPVALVSSSPHDWIDLVVERFDLEGAFDAVVSAEDVDAPGKPDPAIFEHAAAELGVPATECVTVEDSEHGLEAASRAGTTVVAYRIAVHDDLDLAAADRVVDDPEALRRAVLELTA